MPGRYEVIFNASWKLHGHKKSGYQQLSAFVTNKGNIPDLLWCNKLSGSDIYKEGTWIVGTLIVKSHQEFLF
jgi:hypothetical protein